MREPYKIDEVMLDAFVDDQLDAANREVIIQAMDTDENLRNRVYALRKIKDLIKLSFGEVTPPKANQEAFVNPVRRQCMVRMAASIAAMAIAVSAGFAGYNYGANENIAPEQNLAELTQQQGMRIIVHINESDPVQFETTLAYTEKFLKKHKDNGKAQIEVVANAGGIDLLREDYPLSDKVANMMEEYDNLTFIACTNAINKLRAQGLDPSMIKTVETEKAALTHIIDRLQHGWTYVKADANMLKI